MKNLSSIIHIEKSDRDQALSLTASELRSLYFVKEKHIDELVCAAVELDEGQRRLALRLIKAMVDHRRSMLS